MAVLFAAASALLAGLISTPVLIPFLRKLKFGQSIREEGPAWHKKKSGTPTMGGLAIIFSATLAMILSAYVSHKRLGTDALILIISTALFGAVGFVDDFIKVVMKRNLGLSAKSKFALQILVSVFTSVLLIYMGVINEKIILPFVGYEVNIGFFIIPLCIFVQLAVVNSVNLTDGLDGLASGITFIVCLFLTAAACLMQKMTVACFAAAVCGALAAFLVFNKYPAKVFMGDTGSLYLCGAVAVSAIMLKLPVILIIVGGVYLIETLSVIIQVTSFKTRGKRVFKMTPIHHHFEMLGYSERKIVLMFCAAALVLCIAGFLSILSFVRW